MNDQEYQPNWLNYIIQWKRKRSQEHFDSSVGFV